MSSLSFCRKTPLHTFIFIGCFLWTRLADLFLYNTLKMPLYCFLASIISVMSAIQLVVSVKKMCCFAAFRIFFVIMFLQFYYGMFRCACVYLCIKLLWIHQAWFFLSFTRFISFVCFGKFLAILPSELASGPFSLARTPVTHCSPSDCTLHFSCRQSPPPSACSL